MSPRLFPLSLASLLASLTLSLLVALLPSSGRAQTHPCGADAPCGIDEDEYYLAFPPDWDGSTPLPAVLFFHVYRSSGKAMIQVASRWGPWVSAWLGATAGGLV